ncbi:hypothetical protein H5410_038462 [Solanum commersonii]|uniref:Uncharacterized protein n=1 Tax=Solanum commersonii TaxID=4109 RepID=A0A9J5YE09_SOLCO|nr:hypothetical protein H5410_038462 [Solanum commersonii]
MIKIFTRLPIKSILRCTSAYVNGASHWIASKWDVLAFVNVIVLFNMHDETFSEMILPSSLINESRSHYDEMFLFVSGGISLFG